MTMVKTIRSLFWTIYLRLRGAKIGKNLKVLGHLNILLRDGASFRNLVIGNDVILGGNVYIRIRKSGRILLANGVRTGTEVWLVAANDNDLDVGENASLGSYSILNGGHGLKIGAYCIFAAFVYINTSDHTFNKGELIQNQVFFGAPIEIGEDVWVGGHSFINKGVKIGKGSVIGAGAVVTKDLPEYKIAVGNPAKVIKDRD